MAEAPGRWNRRRSERWSSPLRSSGSWPTISPAWRRGWPAWWAPRGPVPVEVTDREPERILAWRTTGPAAGTPGSRSSWPRRASGPSVSITAQHSRPDGAGADAVLEQLLDELGSPGRRPFAERADQPACVGRRARAWRALVKARGRALLDALERHLPGSRDHADGTASYAFAAAVELGVGRARAEAVREAARLHEVGKVYLPRRCSRSLASELTLPSGRWSTRTPPTGRRWRAEPAMPEQACEWIGACRRALRRRRAAGLAGDPSRSRRGSCGSPASATGSMRPARARRRPDASPGRAISAAARSAARGDGRRHSSSTRPVVESLAEILERAA